jgi:hypothetical protein
MEPWLRTTLILGAVAVLVVLNVLEFRSKRRADAKEMERLADDADPATWFARKRYVTLQNIEQVLHIMNTVLIAILVAILTA